MERSPQWRDGTFRNVHERVDGPMLTILRKMAFGGSANRKPGVPIETEARTAADYVAPPAS